MAAIWSKNLNQTLKLKLTFSLLFKHIMFHFKWWHTESEWQTSVAVQIYIDLTVSSLMRINRHFFNKCFPPPTHTHAWLNLCTPPQTCVSLLFEMLYANATLIQTSFPFKPSRWRHDNRDFLAFLQCQKAALIAACSPGLHLQIYSIIFNIVSFSVHQ